MMVTSLLKTGTNPRKELMSKSKLKREQFTQSVINNIDPNNESMLITGTAVTYDQLNLNGYQLTRKTFENFDFNKQIPVYSEHDRKLKLGVAKLTETQTGINFEIQLNKNKQISKDAWEDVKLGTTPATSIGFRADFERLYSDEWELLEIIVTNGTITEISLVDDPADTTAQIKTIQTTNGGQKMSRATKEVLGQLESKQFKAPSDYTKAINELEAEKKLALQSLEENKLILQNQNDETDETELKTAEQSVEDFQDEVSLYEESISELKQQKKQMVDGRAKRLKKFKAEQKKNPQPFNAYSDSKFTEAEEVTQFVGGLKRLVTQVQESETQGANSNTEAITLQITNVIAKKVIEEAKKDNKAMWPYVTISTETTGEIKTYVPSKVNFNKQSGKYKNNIQPTESTLSADGTVLLTLGTITTFIKLNDMEIKGTETDILKNFISRVKEWLAYSLDSDIYNHQTIDSNIYTGFLGLATQGSIDLDLSRTSEFASFPTLNDYLKQEANNIGMFTHVWCNEVTFNEWAYEVDANNIPLHNVTYDGEIPMIRGKKFIFSEFIPLFADATQTQPFAIAMTPSLYEITPPTKGTLFSVAERLSPSAFREREQAFFIDGLGLQTKKGKVSISYPTGVVGASTQTARATMTTEADAKIDKLETQIDSLTSGMTKFATMIESLFAKKPADEKPADEKPADEKPADEKPADEKPADEKPADEKPADEKPADEKPADEKPADEKPADEKPADEKPADEKPADEKPADEKPADEKPKKGKKKDA